MTENGSDWEQAKENIQPLRQGRKMACLRAALAPRAGKEQRHQQQQAFENELRTYDGDDPLSVWHKYIEWVEQNYPKGGNSGNIQQLIGQCVSSFLEDQRYQNDKRYIDIWLKYATNFTNTLEIYSYMYSQNIGCKTATFFENWAWELQQMGNTKKAYAILQEGLQRLAEPRKILLDAEKALQAKMVAKCKDYNMSEEQTDVDQHRSALNSLQPTGNNRAPIRRVGDARLEELVQLPPVQHFPSQSSQPFQVFNDENTFPSHLPTSKESSSKFVSKDKLNKENDLKPGKWSGAALKSKSGRPRDTNPGFTIHEDESDSVPSRSSVKLPTNHHVLSTRKAHYSPPRALFEPPNPNVIPMYNKYKVYGGAEEFQFEEIRAARWLAKRKEEERIIEEKRKKALEDEVRFLRDDLMKLKLQISSSDNMSQQSTTSTTSSESCSPTEEEHHANPPRSCSVESAAPAQPTEVRVTSSQSISLNASPTRQVQALWNVSLFHNSNHKMDPEDDQSGLSLHRHLPFKIHEDSKVLKEDDQENLKENLPPKEYVQSDCKRSLAGILQQSTNVPMLPLEQQDSDDSDEDDSLGTCPLPSSQETTVAVVTPEQFNEDAAWQCASTPFQKTFVPHSVDDGFTSSLASVIISAM